MRLIGQKCKRGDTFSLLVLIGRGLDLLGLLTLRSLSLTKLYSVFRVLFPCNLIVGVDCCEVPPVPIPNTEVKLVYVENTWLVTTWEDRAMPTLKSNILCYSLVIFLHSSVGSPCVTLLQRKSAEFGLG